MSQEELKNNVLCENLHNHVLRSWDGGGGGGGGGGGMAPLALSPNDIISSYKWTNWEICCILKQTASP